MHKPENSPFVLKSSNETFLQRQKSVFDQLNNLQTTLKSNVVEDMETNEEAPMPKRSGRSAMRQFRGKESIFKRPHDPISKNYMRSIPDFKKNPHKWKKYSLEDVRDEHMSETCNTRAALSFLDELKKRNQTEDKREKVPDEAERIVFKKVYKSVQEDDQKSKPSFRSSKVVMPEYVVGQKIAKEKKHGKSKTSATGQLKLDHLYED